jgi:hypothetical protein
MKPSKHATLAKLSRKDGKSKTVEGIAQKYLTGRPEGKYWLAPLASSSSPTCCERIESLRERD